LELFGKLFADTYRLEFTIIILSANPAKLLNTMANRIQKFRRLWRISPRLAFAYLRRKASRQAKKFLPVDEWNINWLGEEMRPFNSLR